jgi:CBS domain-containing protein
MLDGPLDTLITYNPVAVTPETTIDDARRLMQDYGIRHFPVVESGQQLVGMVSDVDLVLASERRSESVTEIMSRHPHTIRRTATPLAALRAIVMNGFHSLPVVEDGELVGIVTSTDFLREFSYAGGPVAGEPVVRHMIDADAQVEPTATHEEALRLMDQLALDHLAVVKGDCPVGVVARRVLCQRADSAPPDASITSGVCTRAPIVRPHETLGEAAAKLADAACTAALVVDRNNRLIGLLTVDRVLATIASSCALSTV